MRKRFICMMLFFACICDVKASYCVMNGNDGTVTDSDKMHETQSVASISKIMTAIVAIEEGKLEESWKVSDAILKVDGSSIYLKVGDEVTLRDLLYGLMLRSGNDAAVEIADHIGGSIDGFVDKMNEKAEQIGMKDSIFRNPSGLDETDGGNISSAYDMALLMRYAMQNDTFKEIAGSKYYDFKGNRWMNKNKLLFTYDATTAGKTGYTKKAGRTLVSSAADNDLESIVVTLNMGGDFAFHKTTHEQQLSGYEAYPVIKAGTYQLNQYEFDIEKTVFISVPKEGTVDLSIDSEVKDGILKITVKKDDITLEYEYSGKRIKEKGGWFS